jgi:hypothetical protein
MKSIYSITSFILFASIFNMALFSQSEIQSNNMNEWLKETSYIDYSNPLVKAKISELTIGKKTDIEKANSIFLFVRDEIFFGWSAKFYDSKASEVLTDKVGYCNTKSTLFVALLRGAGIPARQSFVEITGNVLFGFSIPNSVVDHSYTEIFLDNKWISVDSYVIDKRLYQNSINKLKQEKLEQGYGIHIAGTIEWDGKSDAFIQYVPSNTKGAKHWGNFSDIEEFYNKAQGTHNKLNFFYRMMMPVFLSSPNASVKNLRQ